MNKINIILITIILLVFLLYKFNDCKNNDNKILENFAQSTTLNMQFGLNNDGNNGACGGGGAGGTGVAGTTTKSNGGLPLTGTSGKAGGDGFDTNTIGGGGGGYGSSGFDNTDATNPGKGGTGSTLTVEPTTITTKYCTGGNGGVSGANYVAPITSYSPTIYGCGGNGASNKGGTSTTLSWNGDNGTYGVVYMIFLNSSNVPLTHTGTGSLISQLGTAMKVSTLSTTNTNINININGNGGVNTSGCDLNYTTLGNYLKFYIPVGTSINKLDYVLNIDNSFTTNNQTLNCNIHIIGGGGGGGGCFDNSRTGGGGGAGQYVTSTNFTFACSGTHYFTIGNGGMGGFSNNNGNDGFDTTASLNTNTNVQVTTTQILNFIASGGGGGAGGGVTNNSKNENLIKRLIRKIYVADVDAIRNLSNYANKILSGGLQVDGKFKVADKIVLVTGTDVGPPKTISTVAAATSINLDVGDVGTKLVLKSGINGLPNTAQHPYALGVNNSEMWCGLPFSIGNTITSTIANITPTTTYPSGVNFTTTVNTVTSALTIPTDYFYTTVPNKFNWYSGNRAVLTLDANSNLILGLNQIGYNIPSATGPTSLPANNTLYTVYLNIGTTTAGSLLSFSNSNLNISSNLNLGTNTITCGAITSTGTLGLGTNTITCGAITSTGTLGLGTNTITCGAITSTGALTTKTNSSNALVSFFYPTPYNNGSTSKNQANSVINLCTSTTAGFAITSPYLSIKCSDIANAYGTIVTLSSQGGYWSGYNMYSSIVLDSSFETNGSRVNCGTISFNSADRTISTINIDGINLLNENYIQFGSDQAKGDGAAGQIRYNTYQGGSLCIVGTTTRGQTSGARKICMLDNVQVTGNLSSASLNTGDLSCGTVNCGAIIMSARINNQYWLLTNESDYCRLRYRSDENSYFNFAANNIYGAGDVVVGSTWTLRNGKSNNGKLNSLMFIHGGSTWWFAGDQTSTQSEISDERVKKNIKDINNSIELLNKLKPKEFILLDDKDEIFKFGLISQQVKEVFPQLVSNDNNYIANIFIMGTYDNKIITISKNISNIIKVGDKIKIILDNNENKEFLLDKDDYYNRNKKRFAIIKKIINEYSFEVEDEIQLNNNNEVFIYGTYTTDFNKLDYKSIFSLNVAATQELYKEHLQLKEEHDELKNKFNYLLNKYENIEKRLSCLKI